ncbi:MAG: precorrin-8X methylmutase [Actinobacteria bacterium]|nr:precorrin-8X methylmutase [Actinomycetota bacterium]
MSTGFIVLGHGSRVSETVAILKDIKDCLEARLQSNNVRYAALQFNEPGLPEVIADFVNGGITEIVILPLFLVDGNHIRDDIPGIVRRASEKFPSVNIMVAGHIGADVRITDILLDRVDSIIPKNATGNELKISEPARIEEESFRMIEAAVDLQNFNDNEKAVVKRMIHASGDLSLANAIAISEGAVDAGIEAFREGHSVITDVRMVAVGISDRRACIHDNSILCKVDDSVVESEARRTGRTRSAMAMRFLASYIDGAIVAIGNAPTALFELLCMARESDIKPALVIGTPVGFIGAAESKEALVESGINYITIRGTRGGSAVAVAATNAILKISCDGNSKQGW